MARSEDTLPYTEAAAAYKAAKDDLDALMASIAAAKAQYDKLGEAMRSGAFISGAAFAAQKKIIDDLRGKIPELDKSLTKAGENADKSWKALQKTTADYAKQTLGELRASISATTTNFLVAEVAIAGMMKVTSPATFQTFTGSLEMLTRQIGMAFIPEVVKVSFWIQDAADWVRNLDETTKENIASWAAFVLKIMGVVAAFGMAVKIISLVVPLFTVLASAIKLVVLAVNLLTLSLAINPLTAWLVVIGALIAAVGVITLGVKGMANAFNSAATSAAALEAVQAKLAAGQPLTKSDIAGVTSEEDRQQMAAARARGGIGQERSAAARRSALAGERARDLEGADLGQVAEKLRAGQSIEEASKGLSLPAQRRVQGMAQESGITRLAPEGSNLGMSAADQQAEMRRQAQEARAGSGPLNTREQIDKFANALESAKDAAKTQRDALKAVGEGQGPGGTHKQAFPHEMAVQATAIEQARMSFQQGALKDPMEQEKIADQRKAWAAQEKAAETLDEINKKIPEGKQVPAPGQGGVRLGNG